MSSLRLTEAALSAALQSLPAALRDSPCLVLRRVPPRALPRALPRASRQRKRQRQRHRHTPRGHSAADLAVAEADATADGERTLTRPHVEQRDSAHTHSEQPQTHSHTHAGEEAEAEAEAEAERAEAEGAYVQWLRHRSPHPADPNAPAALIRIPTDLLITGIAFPLLPSPSLSLFLFSVCLSLCLPISHLQLLAERRVCAIVQRRAPASPSPSSLCWHSSTVRERGRERRERSEESRGETKRAEGRGDKRERGPRL